MQAALLFVLHQSCLSNSIQKKTIGWKIIAQVAGFRSIVTKTCSRKHYSSGHRATQAGGHGLPKADLQAVQMLHRALLCPACTQKIFFFYFDTWLSGWDHLVFLPCDFTRGYRTICRALFYKHTLQGYKSVVWLWQSAGGAESTELPCHHWGITVREEHTAMSLPWVPHSRLSVSRAPRQLDTAQRSRERESRV